jgi:hypothetical protein
MVSKAGILFRVVMQSGAKTSIAALEFKKWTGGALSAA